MRGGRYFTLATNAMATALQFSELVFRAAFCDPASGKREIIRRIRARSAVVVVGADAMTRLFVLHAWADRCSTNTLIEKILETQSQFHPNIFGIEANAMQSLFADAVGREARQTNRVLPLIPVNQPTKIDKDWRIRTALQPVIGDGRLFIQPTQYELKGEMTSFPMTITKDIIDALASCVALIPHQSTRRDFDNESRELAEYLRSSGAPASYIEQRLSEVYREAGFRDRE